MSTNKLTQARAAFGALIVGSTTGNPARGIGAGPPLPTQFPANTSPTTVHLIRRSFVDMTASGLWAASVTTANSGIQPVPFIGSYQGDQVVIQPMIPEITGVIYDSYMANAFDLTAAATTTAYIAGQVVAAQTIATYTRTTAARVNAKAIVLDSNANFNDLGAHITGTGVAANTVVVHVTPGVGFVMNKAATSSSSATLSFLPFSALACSTAGTSGGSAPTFTNAPLPGNTLTDGTVVWTNLGPACPVLHWTNVTGSTISAGAGLLAAYQVSLYGTKP